MAMETVTQYAVQYGMQAIVAVGIFSVGILLARWAGNLAQQRLEGQTLEPPVRMLLVRVIKIVVLLFTAVIALDALGVPIAPLVAGIGVAGVGIGLALQGVLSNVMAGLSTIFTKPYKVGEHISLLDVHGDVGMIDIMSTTLMHPDHSAGWTCPTGRSSAKFSSISGPIPQLHLTVEVSYKTDLNQALALVQDILSSHAHVLKEPAPDIGVSRLGHPAITIAVEPWAKVVHYGSLQGELSKAMVERFRSVQIEFPAPPVAPTSA